MSDDELQQQVEQRIQERFDAVRLVGGGMVGVAGGGRNFAVSITKPTALPEPITTDPDVGKGDYTIIKAEHNNGETALILIYGGASMILHLTYLGRRLDQSPHPVINIT